MDNQNSENSPHHQEPPIIIQTTWAKATEKIGVRTITMVGVVIIPVLVIIFSFLFANRGADMPWNFWTEAKDTTGKVLDKGEALLRAFKTGTIKQEIISHSTYLTGHSRYQIAELNEVAVFKESDSVSYFWEYLPLPDITTEIMVPTTYVYYVDLGKTEKWDIEWDQLKNSITVIAPPIRWNTPAPNISEMERETKSSIIRFGEEKMEEKLRRGVTAGLEIKAKENVSIIREQARSKFKDFIEQFILNGPYVDIQDKPSIEKVTFWDEISGGDE